MKNLNIILCALFACLITSCGISNADMQEMQKDAQFFTERWDIFAKTKLSNIQSGNIEGSDSKYKANFTTTIERDSMIVVLSGEMGFNKFNKIAFFEGPKTKMAVIVNKITVNDFEMPIGQFKDIFPDIIVDDSEEVALSKQDKAVKELISWGADDAYFDEDGYLVYVTNLSNLSDAPNNVAKNLYPMFEDTPGIKGIKIMTHEKTQLGIYTAE